ncbi:uncharacterized protein LOC124161477 [Ischnura elegans]|uniref:uncharacterized protein LOC124161477 n=1 Tax=Ischnura elegans TaxID=197161 RepID=UPI001ED88C9E|nr:uncharacterized protein LOC124161477 [Ischnura elegans]
MDSVVDTELLIGEVEKRPNLRDVSHDKYKDRDLRLKAWEEITQRFYPRLQDMEQNEKKKTVDRVQKRWKTARDAYFKSRNKARATKSGSAAAKVIKYIYHDLLQFLDSVRECTTECSLEQETFETDETQELPTNDNFSSQANHHKKDDFRRKRPQKGPSAFEDSLLSLLRDSREKEDDDDRAFFTSIMPLLKTFNLDQKLMFRTEVLQLMTRIKNVSSQQPQFTQTPYIPSSSPKGPVQNLYLSKSLPHPSYQYMLNQATAPLPSPSTSTSSWETL